MAINHMQNYLKNETPEQKKARIEKGKATLATKRLAQNGASGTLNASGEFVGIRVNISAMTNGVYLKGTSKTILLTRKAFSGNTDELRDHLTAFLRTLKKERVGKSVVTI